MIDNQFIATFVTYNDNPVPIRDVNIACVHAGGSGTRVLQNGRSLVPWVSHNDPRPLPDVPNHVGMRVA